MRSLSIIVPAKDERGNLHGAVLDILTALRRVMPESLDQFELILIDDGSTDGTIRLIKCWADTCAFVRAVYHPHNLGLRAAYESGLALAQYEYVMWLPSTGEMSSASIEAIFRAIGTADLVVPYHGNPGARTWLRRLLTWGSTTELNLLLGHHLRYFQGTVVYRADVARRLPRTERGMFCQAEMLCHALEEGLTYAEVPLEHIPRSYGQSASVSWGRIWAAQTLMLRLWWRLRVRPLYDIIAYGLEGV